jgi:hypothetical protein
MKRLLLIWNGIEVIRTVPMSLDDRAVREKNWREFFPGKGVQIVTED